jgi:hypothetical protein
VWFLNLSVNPPSGFFGWHAEFFTQAEDFYNLGFQNRP